MDLFIGMNKVCGTIKLKLTSTWGRVWVSVKFVTTKKQPEFQSLTLNQLHGGFVNPEP